VTTVHFGVPELSNEKFWKVQILRLNVSTQISGYGNITLIVLQYKVLLDITEISYLTECHTKIKEDCLCFDHCYCHLTYCRRQQEPM
jgi:hypothetical protein